MATTESKISHPSSEIQGSSIHDHFNFMELPENDKLTDFPKFQQLLYQLTRRILPNGCSISVGQQLETAMEKLKPHRLEYLQNQLLYNELTDLIYDFDVKAVDSKLDPITAKFHKDLKSVLAASQCRQALHCLQVGDMGEERHMKNTMGLGFFEKKLYAPAMRNLEITIEKRLKQKLDEIIEFHAASSSKSKEMQSYLEFPSIIEGEKSQLIQARQNLVKVQREVIRLYRKIYECLSENCQLLSRIGEILLANECTSKELHILKTQASITTLKIEVFRANLMSQMYSADVIKAHQIIRTQLDLEATKLGVEKTRIEETLLSYENVDQNFPKLLKEYKKLKTRIEQFNWLNDEAMNST